MNDMFAIIAIVIGFGFCIAIHLRAEEATVIRSAPLPTRQRTRDRPSSPKFAPVERVPRESRKAHKTTPLTSNGLLVAAAVFAGIVVVGCIGSASRRRVPAKPAKPRLPKPQQHLHIVPDLVPPADELQT